MTKEQGAAKGKCPVCGKPRSERFRPFCSSRCADVDLNRWLNQSYVVPGDEVKPHAGAEAFDEDED